MKNKIFILIVLVFVLLTSVASGSGTRVNSITPVATSGTKSSVGVYYWTGGVWREGTLNKTAYAKAISYAKYNDGSYWYIDQIRATVVMTVGSTTYAPVGTGFSTDTAYVKWTTQKSAFGSLSCCTEHEWRESGYQTVIKEESYS